MNTNRLAQTLLKIQWQLSITFQILVTKYSVFKIPLLKQNNETKYKCSIDMSCE